MDKARSLLLLFCFLAICIWVAEDLPVESASFSGNRGSESESCNYSKRENAYRANNLGVALLEQYKSKEAVDAFTRALELDPELSLARINLSIAFYYLPDPDRAEQEAEKAVARDPKAPQPHYILGLVARTQNRLVDAMAEFQKVLEIDADDVATNVNLGQLLTQQKKYSEAIVAFRKAIAAEPYNETALYNLGILLIRTGAREEGQRVIQRFQQYRQSGSGTTVGTNYLEGGRYAEAIASTGAEADVVDRLTPDVRFVEAIESGLSATEEAGARAKFTNDSMNRRGSSEKATWGPFEESARNSIASMFKSPATLFDFDNDGDLDLIELSELSPSGLRLLRNDKGRFVAVTSQSGALNEKADAAPVVAVAGDYDNDGRTDILVVRYGKISLYHNDGNGRFSDHTAEAGIPAYDYLAITAAFVDVDHDGDLDIFIAGFANLSKTKAEGLLGQDSPLLRKDFKLEAPHDPFKLIENLPGAPNLLLRNNGNGTFTNITSQSGVGGSLGHAVGVVPTDYDNRRDIDLLVVNYGAAPDLFSNQRDGSFRRVTEEAGLEVSGKWTCVAAGDLNKDGYTDFFFGRSNEPGLFALSDGKAHFKTVPAPVETRGASAAEILDYDNDGLLDLITVSEKGPRVWRSVGDSWVDVSERAVGVAGWSWERTLASGDLDEDGDRDLLVQTGLGGLKMLRNEGGNRNHSIALNLHGRVSNKSAVEAKVEVRAGSLWQKLETYSATPAPAPADLLFGLGKREAPDAVRVLWPAGIVQAETEFPAASSSRQGNGTPSFISVNITELDRKPSSCPYLYTWNGERFEFITDFMGGGEIGYLEEPGRYNSPDPEEYVRITEHQMQAKDGRYELRVTNELEEALFVDRLQLLAVAHPSDVAVYPNEGMSDPPKPFKLYLTHDARPPLSAFDEHGHDVLSRITRLDRRYPDDFRLDHFRGYAEEHTLTMKLFKEQAKASPLSKVQSPIESPRSKVQSPMSNRKSKVQSPMSNRKSNVQSPMSNVNSQNASAKRQTLDVGHWTLDNKVSPKRTVLLLTGWTDYAWSSDNVAASQAGRRMKPPALQVKDARGHWRTVIQDIGIPVGRPQTVVIDLTGRFLGADREVRIVTNMRVYWDQILIDSSRGEFSTEITRLDPVHADLHWRGFSAGITPDNREPFRYDYQRVSYASPWKVMTGHYTRAGDVRELLLKSDDMFVICLPGDEISLSFEARALPPLPVGWTRTFLLYADGFSKEMDINSASPDQISPLPFHGMSRYPYTWPEHYPMTKERRSYVEKYNTRVVASPIPAIETTRGQ